MCACLYECERVCVRDRETERRAIFAIYVRHATQITLNILRSRVSARATGGFPFKVLDFWLVRIFGQVLRAAAYRANRTHRAILRAAT